MKFVKPRVVVVRAVTLRPDGYESQCDVQLDEGTIDLPSMPDEGVSFLTVYQPRGWDTTVTPKKHYADACWRYFAPDGEELSWAQVIERYRTQYPHLTTMPDTFTP
jgi:hypothetical protein